MLHLKNYEMFKNVRESADELGFDVSISKDDGKGLIYQYNKQLDSNFDEIGRAHV